MKPIITFAFTALISMVSATCFAQDKVPAPMQPLTVLLGNWTGSGYQSRGPDNRIDFSQTEQVTAELDGRLLVFRGTGTSDGEDSPGFKAFGVMTYDEAADQVFLHAWTLDGQYTKATVEISDGVFQWSFDVPNGGMVRYTATFTESTWAENGEYSPDKGTTWYPFMEMNLTR